MTIPKIIHLVYSTPSIPEHYAVYFKSIRALHPHWEIRVYGDQEARSVVSRHMPWMTGIYDAFSMDVQRTDVFRLAVVYVYGGFYMDMDMLCLQNLDQLCGHRLVLGEEKTLTEEECADMNGCHPLRIANYMFGSIPGHPFWLAMMDGVIHRRHTIVIKADDVLDSTGPGLLTDVYHQVKEDYDDITVLFNKDRKCLKWCERVSCHFGEYAAHFHHGGWRDQLS